MWGLIYPYIEQAALYDALQYPPVTSPLTPPVTLSSWSWFQISQSNPTWTNAFGNVSIYRCPSRRGGGTLVTQRPDALQNSHEGTFLGPIGDYVVPLCMPDTYRWYQHSHPHDVANGPFPDFGLAITTYGGADVQHGPFRIAIMRDRDGEINIDTFKRWNIRDSFAWFQDGTSNQIMAGEKYLAPSAINVSEGIVGSRWGLSDCSYLMTGEHRSGAARGLVYFGTTAVGLEERIYCHRIAMPREFEDSFIANDGDAFCSTGYAMFGSWHPTICQFLMGDGAVRSLSVSTSPENILGPLGVVDGFTRFGKGSISLP
jgi:hypothetical protein